MPDNNTQEVKETNGAGAAKPKAAKLAAHYSLPQSPTETLVKIIKGYAIASNGGDSMVNYKDVASATGLNPTIVSRNNAFLNESEIITSPKYGYFLPSEAATKFAREAAWDEPNAKIHLRRSVSNSWYATVVNQNFMTRQALTHEDLLRVLAIKSGATEGDAKNLSCLVDFLSFLGIISETENGAFTRGVTEEITASPSQPSPTTAVAPSIVEVEAIKPANVSIPSASTIAKHTGAKSGLTLHINLNVSVASVKDLTEEDAKALRRWIRLVIVDSDESE